MISTVLAELEFIFFTPGDYKISVVAQYWTSPDSIPRYNPQSPSLSNADGSTETKGALPKDNYHTITESATIRVTAPQSVILLGAAFGGIIAYLLFPQARDRLNKSIAVSNWAWKNILGLFLSIGLSAIVAILFSRVSEAQLPIHVTVTDFWGAIAIGFVATYIGSQIFERLLPSEAKPSPGPSIDKIVASLGSLKLEIHGRYLSRKAMFRIDNVDAAADLVELHLPQVDEKENQTQETDMYKVLRLETANPRNEWLQGEHKLTVINPDGQHASWPFIVEPVAVEEIHPPTAEVKVGRTYEFTAIVKGTSNTAVKWSLNRNDAGSITEAGVYTAPNTIPDPPMVIITAASVVDLTKSATATVTIVE